MSFDEKTVAIDVQDVIKKFGSIVALQRASLKIFDNEFFTILGPSGCGKTTLLRLIAGFEDVTDGAIFLYDEEIERLPPHKRPVNTVFQQYALFPHMTVAENVAFGIRMKGGGRQEIEATVLRMLDLVKMGDLADRRPNQLSGGQQQRAALARAIAPEPKVLLLDEPLSALDLKLRQAMRLELKQLQQETGITFVFVTHDQEEALAMSDRIAVMSDGIIQQVGGAREIYDNPVNRFVANFIGETNLLDVIVEQVGSDGCVCTIGTGAPLHCSAAKEISAGQKACALIRPERLRLASATLSNNGIVGSVRQAMYLGTDIKYSVLLDDGVSLSVRSQNGSGQEEEFAIGDRVGIELDKGVARLLAN